VNRPLDYLALAVAGGVGVLLRVGCTALAVRMAGPGSAWAAPAAILAVNTLGSFLFGAVSAVAGSRAEFPASWSPIILAGLIGGFTTYSTFSFQAVEMLSQGRAAAGLAYVLATNLLALAAAWAGLQLKLPGSA
jgi:CrcB protein